MDPIKFEKNQNNSPESFTFQQWPVYKESIKLSSKVTEIRTKMTKSGHCALSEQLRRAVDSIPLNLAEGYSRSTKRDKQTFLRIAKGSAFECVAIMDILKSSRVIDENTYEDFHSSLLIISRMISLIINHLEKNLRR